ncbi:MAG: ribonuclease E/G, partial [Okeania sp. SIO2H7]|nr:ribonuclease E/G [Okeania sp. SIO2H7]
RWELIQQEANSIRPPALLNRDDDFIQKVLRDMYSADVNRIVVDSSDGVRRVKQHLANWSGGKTPQVLIDHHRDRGSILEYFRVNAAIREALRPRVDLPSGGYIIIQPTEALTVIDVNSGSFTRSATSRETVLWTNREAATEIARQLRLRNIAGVIVVDFIDMDSRRDQLQVLEHFNNVLRADKARPQISQLSELGLVELTRKRQGQNVYELFGSPCPACGGLGLNVRLPGEDGVGAGSPRIVAPTAVPVEGMESALWNKAPQLANTGNDLVPSSGDRVSGWEYGSPKGLSEMELLNHPSYQESARRRRRRRLEDNVGPIGDGEPVAVGVGGAIGNNFSGVNNAYPLGEAPETSRTGGSVREMMLPAAEPPEVATVEMTGEQRDIFALMGISPLVLLDDGPIENLQRVVVEVVEPGLGTNADNFATQGGENRVPEDWNDSEEQEWADSSSLLSGEAVNEAYEFEDRDLEGEEDYEDEGEDSASGEQPKVVRRRRRRSSASIDE